MPPKMPPPPELLVMPPFDFLVKIEHQRLIGEKGEKGGRGQLLEEGSCLKRPTA